MSMMKIDVDRILHLASLACAEGTSVKINSTQLKTGWIVTATNKLLFADEAWTRKARAMIMDEYASDYHVAFDGYIHSGMVVTFVSRYDQAPIEMIDTAEQTEVNPSQVLAIVEQLFSVNVDVLQIHKTCNFMYMVRADDQTLEEMMPIFNRMKMQDVEIVKTTKPSTLIGFMDNCIGRCLK